MAARIRKDDVVFIRSGDDTGRTGMVRRLVGSLALVGEGRLTVAGFRAILEARDRNHPGAAAPACGLRLSSVEYPVGLISWAA